MKTAVSIQDEVYNRAERLARRMKVSRSRLFSVALDEFVTRHMGDEVTEAMNAAVVEAGEGDNSFVRDAARRTFERNAW